jgi:hypothetical protein
VQNISFQLEERFLFWEKKRLAQIKVAVKQDYGNVDAIIFEAALTLNERQTRHKQKEYVC